jgi:hypothetical protein
MRLRRVVSKIPPISSVPPGLLFYKSHPLSTRSESTLLQVLIPLHFNSPRINTYTKPGGGCPSSSPKVLQLVTPYMPLCVSVRYIFTSLLHFIFCTHSNARIPNPLYALLHGSLDTLAWGLRSPPLAYHCPCGAGVTQWRLTLRQATRRETYPLPAVSKVVRADIGFGIRRLPRPVASRFQGQPRDRTRKKAWVHRSKVGPISRVARAT